MSVKHPIISITGSSGAGTTSVKHTFDQIFRREGMTAAYIEGDAFHRYDRDEMKKNRRGRSARQQSLHPFQPGSEPARRAREAFHEYGETGTGRTRHYVHDDEEELAWHARRARFTGWRNSTRSDLLFYEGLHGAAVTTSRPSRAMPTSRSASCR